MMSEKCIFCSLPPERVLLQDEYCLLFADVFPVSEGHSLIIPKRHAAYFWELSPEEWASMQRLAAQRMEELRAGDKSIEGFNFGFNAGAAAGQTVFHCHAHLIPRRIGDTPKPRGGIRGVIPDKAAY